MRSLAFLLLALALAPLVQAQSFSYGPNGGRASVPLTPQALADGRIVYAPVSGSAGDVRATVSMSATVEGRAVAMSAARNVGWSVLGNALARSLPTIAVGTAAYQILNAVRCEKAGGTVAGQGFTCDPGQAPDPGGIATRYGFTVFPFNSGLVYSSSEAACSAGVARVQVVESPPNRPPYYQFTLGTVDTSNGRCGFTYTYRTEGGDLIDAQGSIDISSGDATVEASCPSVIDFGNPANNIPAGAPPGSDGLCRTPRNQHVQLSPTQVGDRVFQYGNRSLAPELARQITASGLDLGPQAGPVSLSGPATSVAPPRVSTTTNPDGSTSTTSQQRQANITYAGDSYTYNISNTSTTNNGGDTTTTVTEGAPEIEVCGLPGTPPCKIDETGTPEPPADTAQQDVDDATADARAIAAGDVSRFDPFPSISWTFALPTGCGPIPLPGFGEWIESIDICQFQPVFHELMSIVWILGGLFGAISIFWRDQLHGV